MVKRCPGSKNLVFANSRQTVEALASHVPDNRWGEGCGQSIPGPPRVHLGWELREQAKARLKSGQPVTAICTSKLELGIDIRGVEAVFQVDPPCSVLALPARLGRSGRRSGNSAVLHLYTRDRAAGEELSSRLYPELLRGIAVVELMFQGRLEHGNPGECISAPWFTRS